MKMKVVKTNDFVRKGMIVKYPNMTYEALIPFQSLQGAFIPILSPAPLISTLHPELPRTFSTSIVNRW